MTPGPEPVPGDGTETTSLRLPDGDVHVRRDGPRDAPALLLIHGSASSARSFDDLVPLLSATRHVVRVDLLGFGGSDKPDDGDYSLPAQAGRAAAVLDRLGISRATVVGHSTGGAVATALAELRAELVSALVLVNTGPGPDALIAERTPVTARQWERLTDERIRAGMATAFGRPGYVPPQRFVADVRAMTLASYVGTMRASTAYLERRSIPDRLTALDVPALVLFGAEDGRWRAEVAVAAYRAVAGVRVEVLAGLGHTPIAEDPSRVAAPLLDFTGAH